MSNLVKIFLLVSAAVLILIGALLSFTPEVLYASSGQNLTDVVLIRSDLRAGGMLLLLSGLVVLAAALRGRHTTSALQLSALIYLGYGLGRLFGIGFDGAPDAMLIAVTGVEWALGLGALALLRWGQTGPEARVLAPN
ncbi:DUF4345 domain-containing protein [Ruegeria sp. PrR005]|uniref:DUF4345 domain-containing protein n=1 Tax=Ruegeria sp. PrR005 TaxID=2706882 RepID=A0A6B2NQW6_9RHOB|nr:DUF4345 domain-containing protein [Ruegeria sp. PrR005]NDW45203.1 DUF4345 domain-containing protein [Ruegeria sp. PrR005]